MKQTIFSTAGFDLVTKGTRKRIFLEEMNLVEPWAELANQIAPHSAKPTGAKGGHPTFPVETMLRIHFLQQWFGLSDPAMEEALYDTPLTRLPDESTILRFRHLLEQHHLDAALLNTINATLATKGLMLNTGTVVDAILIAVPSSAKNQGSERDPEMHQTQKGKQWYFGMKAHIGVDAQSGLMHTVIGTAANVNDVTQGHALLHGDESVVFTDAWYQGEDKPPEATGVAWHIAIRPGKRCALNKHFAWEKLLDQAEQLKSSICAEVEHPFRVLQCQFGFT